MAKKTKRSLPQSLGEANIKSFLDMIAPSVVSFMPDHFICGNTYRCVWALREYPTSTDEQAILRHLGEKDGVTLRIYTRQVTPAEEKRIIQNAANKNRLNSSNTNDLQQTVTAESNLQDVATLVAAMHRNREPLLHCAVFIELTASDYNTLKLLQTDVLTELVRSKLNVDRLLLRQQQGFRCVNPSGYNAFGTQFERVLPASSVANLYPFNYSGKLDSKGFYIGKDKYGSNILVDFDQRDEDKTSANILILGNSGQGKSYLMKLLILNLLESGKSVISLDAEHEQQEMCEAVGGCFADLMAGQYIINVLEPKCWDDGGDPNATDAPEAFRKSTLLAQHISFLKDFFRAYKDFSDAHIDTIEIMLSNQLPEHEYERISQEIWQEAQANKQAQEAARRFAVFHVTEGGSSSYFVAEENLEMLQVACRLRSYIRKPSENHPARFTGMFSRGEKISNEQFNAYVSERLENTGRVTGAFNIDLDSGRFDALHIMDGWQCFRIQDISSAAYYANKKTYASQDERWKVFLDHLDGKQFTQEGEPVYLSGSRTLRSEDISFAEDIIQNDNLLEFYMELSFDADKVFGTHVCTTENDDWLNVYANYNMEARRVCDTLEVYLVRGNGSEQDYKYRLTEEEQALLLPKMEDYCQQHWGQSLEECCADYLAEQNQVPQGMQM